MMDAKSKNLSVTNSNKDVVTRPSGLATRGLHLVDSLATPIQQHTIDIIYRFTGHSDRINCLSVSNDGTRMLSGSSDMTAILWNISHKKEIMQCEGHRDYITCVAFSPDGRFVATGSADNTIKLWNINEKQEILSIDLTDRPFQMRWVDSNYIWLSLYNSDSTLSNDVAIGVLDINTRSIKYSMRQTFQNEDGLYTTNMIELSMDSTLALTYSVYNPKMILWNTRTGAIYCESEVCLGTLFKVGFSPQKSFLILTGTNNYRDSEIILWDLNRSCESFRFTIPKRTEDAYPYLKTVWDLSISPDSRFALFAMCDQVRGYWGEPDPNISLYDLRTGQQLGMTKGHSEQWLYVSFLPDGSHAVSGGEDHTILLYSLPMPR